MSMKQQLDGLVLSQRDAVFALGDELYAHPELGFFETETASIIERELRREGIPFRSGLARTGVCATLGSGGYHIALTADMDAIEVTHEGERIPFHSCGHSVQVAVCLAVLAAVHRSGILEKTGGRVSFIATPAEEYIDLDRRRQLVEKGEIRYFSGKQNMVADGLFDDVDCVLNLHVSGTPGVKFDVNSTLAGFSVKKATFLGQAAHSGAAAHLGKNALHAATLAVSACAFLAEQFPAEAGIQLHPVLTEGGKTMNIIPERAVLESYLRAATNDYLFELQQKFDDAMRHCAAALGLGCRIDNTVGYMPLRQNAAINQLVLANMLALCPAEQVGQGPASGASGDVGDLSFLLPTVQIGFSGFSGRIHSDEFGLDDKEHLYMNTARVLAATVADLLENPDKQVRNPNFARDKAFYLENWLLQKPVNPSESL